MLAREQMVYQNLRQSETFRSVQGAWEGNLFRNAFNILYILSTRGHAKVKLK